MTETPTPLGTRAEHVLVTGGHGFIGSHLVEALAARGRRITVLDPADPPPDLAVRAGSVRHVRGDVRDADLVRREITPSTGLIIHLSSLVGVDQYLYDPLDVIDIAVTGTRAVLDATRDTGAKLILASTSEVYGRNPDTPWAENSDRVLGPTTADRWSYSTSKAAAEHMTFAHARRYGTRATVLRYFNVYGPRQRPAYVVSNTVHRLLHGDPPLLYDGGEQTRCFTYVRDAVAATLAVAGSRAAEGLVLNVGSERETTVAEIVRAVGVAVGCSVEPVLLDTRTAFGTVYEDIPRRVPDTSRIAGLLGWRATTEIEEGLAETVAWARANDWWAGQSRGERNERGVAR
ncbi:NAD-dependent epimerase/dehydratase family protein [Amycolatopsis rhizosphaerae]|uniref:NAD-dependent epimerase/dehydratase family protein n=1 Tax=Amycolatopsis rhizosphaerae TaxID=2053003 RepID=A0A558DKC3_9PSEU|nr:NAD-dependent epimerase/dehydratase family protein [Amycolatopsis rhizosphaerae]TVT61458.1 NAD-dependent epimerase/dehydratase family protein [Amycolatopsis rhizosphaerae]